MDTNILIIVLLASVLFVAVLVWKAVWLMRKIGEEPEDADSADAEQDSHDAQSGSG